MSMQKTSWPSSANPAAVTRPTYPVPITPIGSRLVPIAASQGSRVPGPARSDGLWQPPAAGTGLVLDPPDRRGDGDQPVVGDRLGERVGHPVGRPLRPPGHQPQMAAVVVEHQ